MNVTTLTTADAQEHLDRMNDARKSLGDKFGEDDTLLLKCYREIVKGRRIIDVNAAFAQSGLNLAGFPKLAIARANRRRVFWYSQHEWGLHPGNIANGSGEFNYAEGNFRRVDDRNRWRLPSDTFDSGACKSGRKNGRRLCANVPYIPTHLRPPDALGNYFILFECNWYWTSDRPVVSPDPFLLKQIRGPLMSVHAEWDLSPLEQTILNSAL